jgi:hypothetical protein
MQKQTTKIREYGTVTKQEIRGIGSGERGGIQEPVANINPWSLAYLDEGDLSKK